MKGIISQDCHILGYVYEGKCVCVCVCMKYTSLGLKST